MERRDFLSTLTAGLVAPAAEPNSLPISGGGPIAGDSPTRKAWRQTLIRDIQSDLTVADLEAASDGDLALFCDILRVWKCGGYSTERSSGLCASIDMQLTGDRRRVCCSESIVWQVESVADILEAAHGKHVLAPAPCDPRLADALVGAAAAFAYVANPEQIQALGQAVARHYARI